MDGIKQFVCKIGLFPYYRYKQSTYWSQFKNQSHTFAGSKIDDGVYLGDFLDAHNREALSKLGVKHVVSCIYKIDPLYPDEFSYKIVPWLDLNSQSVLAELDGIVGYIESALEKDEGVFVHCMQGKSRSGSVVIAYLMKRNGWSFDESLRYVKAKRPLVEPNERFQDDLKQYESYLHERSDKSGSCL